MLLGENVTNWLKKIKHRNSQSYGTYCICYIVFIAQLIWQSYSAYTLLNGKVLVRAWPRHIFMLSACVCEIFYNIISLFQLTINLTLSKDISHCYEFKFML